MSTPLAFVPAESTGNILCCLCGVPTPSTPARMCANCLRQHVDIAESVNKFLTMPCCRGCHRYMLPPASWLAADWESRELLTICLKKCKLPKGVALVDASFIYTEPHSKRIKLKLTVEKEVYVNTILQQSFMVEITLSNLQCTDCQKSYTDHVFKSVVQVRQRLDHKKTFLYLEQIILKHKAHLTTVGIKESRAGLDFFFANRSDANKFVSFLSSVVPTRSSSSEKLISSDLSSNKYNYHYTFSVEIMPICKDDLLYLPRGPRDALLGGSGPFAVVTHISSLISFIDPFTLTRSSVNATQYSASPLPVLVSSRRLVRFVVLSVELLPSNEISNSGKFRLCEVEVARESDLGVNDVTFRVLSHLGAWLKAGDLVLGYDLAHLTSVPPDMEKELNADVTKNKRISEPIVLVKKTYEKKRGKKGRKFYLKKLEKAEGSDEASEMTESGESGFQFNVNNSNHLRKRNRKRKDRAEREDTGVDMEEFLDDVEYDKEFRAEMLLFKNKENGSEEESAERGAKRINSEGDIAGDYGEDEGDEDEAVRDEELLVEQMEDMQLEDEEHEK